MSARRNFGLPTATSTASARRECAATERVMPGVITHSTDLVEHPDLVADRIRLFADRVGSENVIASADCGFGGRTHPQIAWAKLSSLVEGAALASASL